MRTYQQQFVRSVKTFGIYFLKLCLVTILRMIIPFCCPMAYLSASMAIDLTL